MTLDLWYEEAASWVLVPLRTRSPPPLPTDFQMAFLWNVAFATALGWIVYRIYEIYQKPLADLVDVLGIDIPPTPDVSLAGITTDSALLYWKPPENYSAPLRHFIQVNGINVGEFNRSDASVQVTGLQPGCYYSIRAIATNAANFSSLGPLIRLRTVPLTGHDQGKFSYAQTQRDTDTPGFRTSASTDDSLQHGPAQQLSKRISGRRTSSVTHNAEISASQTHQMVNGSEDSGSEETIPQLTKRLDFLRRQQDEIDKQVAEEEEEAERSKANLLRERDLLKQTLKEKEEAQLEFKKQVNELEKQSKATQRKKSAKERLLYQKQSEKQKMRDEVTKWDREIVEMRTDAEAMRTEKADLNEAKEKKIEGIRKLIADYQAANKAMEEEIRIKGNRIKLLERERKNSDGAQNEEEDDSERIEREREQAHEARMHDCQVQYSSLWRIFQQAEVDTQQAQERLAYWLAKRSRDPTQFAPIPGLDFSPVVANTQRRMRQGTSRASNVSLSSQGHPTATPAFNSISSISPTFSSASPFFNMNNGMTVPTTAGQLGMSQGDTDALTGGAPMSPTANMLLPSNLLRDDDAMTSRSRPSSDQGAARGVNINPLALYGQSFTEAYIHGPQSPASETSRSPSLLSSPHDSLHNLHSYYPPSEIFGETDQQSVNSTNSPFTAGVAAESNPIAARRLAGLFNFNRQRGKPLAHDLPLLGTLKQGQSQSFPRNLDTGAPNSGAFDSVGSARRRVSSGTWANPMASLLARSMASPSGLTEGEVAPTGRAGFGRRSRRNMFGSKLEPGDPSTSFDRSSSPRPASIYSVEKVFPRPSTDSQPFGWSIADNARQRSSPLGVDWSTLGGPWSRNNSRRPSVQHGSSSNLSLGSTPLDPEDYQSTFSKQGSAPAPIGTERFQISQRPVTPKLNPAAPSFTTRLFSRNDTKKPNKGERINEKTGEKAKNREGEKPKESEVDSTIEDPSPSNSRLSRDARSIVTATSMAESHDSLEQSTSGTASDSMGSSAPKETLMQRITRKGSSSKFNVPWAKDRASLFSKKNGDQATGGEVEEDAASDHQLGKSMDGVFNTPPHEKANRGSISWSTIMRKSKKGDKAASESSEKTEETETGEDE